LSNPINGIGGGAATTDETIILKDKKN